MREETLLRQHLQNKFDELPVNGNAANDWKKLETALQLAMPAALLWKLWLSKKMLWIYMLVLGGSGVTALVVYQTKQANLATITQPTKQIKSAKPVIQPVLLKPKPTQKTQPAAIVPIAKVQKDTAIDQAVADTIKPGWTDQDRKHKKPLPVRIDTVIRRHKTLPVAKETTNQPERKHKTIPPIVGDTITRKHKTAPYARPNGTPTYHN
jgi:hypothetical protein